MNQKKEIQQLYDLPAQVQAWSSDAQSGLSEAQLSYVQGLTSWDNKRVLDVGAGAGRVALPLAAAGASVFALDIAPSMARALQRRASGADLAPAALQGDSENLPFAADVFDVVLCLEALWLFPNPQKAIAEMRRVVKPGGHVVLGANNKLSFTYLTTIPYTVYCRLRGRPNYYAAYAAGRLRRWLDRAGLCLIWDYGLGLLPPGVNISLAPGYAAPLYPDWLGRWILHLEERYRLGEGGLRRIMKEMLIVAQRPYGLSKESIA